MYKPDRWFVLASGPSQRYADVQRVRGLGTVCAVNRMVFMAPWADVLYAADPPWWELHRPRLKQIQFSGRKVCIKPRAKSYGATEIYPAESAKLEGLGRTAIRQGGNSGYQAINLAYLDGATEIVLLGFDCGYTYGKRHVHEDYPHPFNNAGGVDHWLPRFKYLADDLRSEGVRVVNCTRETRLECFERMTLEDYLHEHS